MTELLVDEYGYLFGGEEAFPVDVIDHDWRTPYPAFVADASFEWESGEFGTLPNIFRHPEIRDWVCDDAAWSVLSGAAGSDVVRIGEGHLGERRMHLIQVTTIVDQVDLESSLVRDYGSYQAVEFPALHRSAEQEVRSRVFRVATSYTDLFVGADLKRVLDDSGITGLAYTPVSFTD